MPARHGDKQNSKIVLGDGANSVYISETIWFQNTSLFKMKIDSFLKIACAILLYLYQEKLLTLIGIRLPEINMNVDKSAEYQWRIYIFCEI